jgi:hypothetical protein
MNARRRSDYNDYMHLMKQGPYLCGLMPFLYTVGLVVGITRRGYERRYCYETTTQAHAALLAWDGKGHPPGPWIKLKGTYEGVAVDQLGPGAID